MHPGRDQGAEKSEALNLARKPQSWKHQRRIFFILLFLGVACLCPLDSMASNGQPVWTVDGVPISTALGGQGVGFAGKPGITMVPNGEGGVFIAWEDLGSASVFAQRLNAAGQPLWRVNGVAVALADGFQLSPRAVSDGAGGAIVVWQDERDGTSGDCFQLVLKFRAKIGGIKTLKNTRNVAYWQKL